MGEWISEIFCATCLQRLNLAQFGTSFRLTARMQVRYLCLLEVTSSLESVVKTDSMRSTRKLSISSGCGGPLMTNGLIMIDILR